MLEALLFDRDGTMIVDVPYNGDPSLVELAPTAREAVDAVRARGLPFAVVSNQSGIARRLLTHAEVDSVNARVAALLGAPDMPFFVCPHGVQDGCGCRKPAAGLITAAAEHLGVVPEQCGVVGDIGADMEAAGAAGARAVLVPTKATRTEEILAAPATARTVLEAVELLLLERS